VASNASTANQMVNHLVKCVQPFPNSLVLSFLARSSAVTFVVG